MVAGALTGWFARYALSPGPQAAFSQNTVLIPKGSSVEQIGDLLDSADLLEGDFPLKAISDYLGHRRLGSTQKYLKIDIPHLREVAMNSGEDLL